MDGPKSTSAAHPCQGGGAVNIQKQQRTEITPKRSALARFARGIRFSEMPGPEIKGET